MKHLLTDIGISSTLITNSGIDSEDSKYLITLFDNNEMSKQEIIEELRNMTPENTLGNTGKFGYTEIFENPWGHTEYFSSEDLDNWE